MQQNVFVKFRISAKIIFKNDYFSLQLYKNQ